MFRKICSLFIILILCTSCASLPLKPISNEDLTDLKGKWEGIRNSTGKFSSERWTELRTTLEIKNDSVPIQASIYFHQTIRGTIEYPAILYIQNGKLVSPSYNLTLYREGDQLRLKGRMELSNYYEELTFWKK